MRSVRDIPVLEGIPVLVRASLNVPVENGQVVNSYRLTKAAATIRYLKKRRAKIVLISHIGEAGTETLAPVATALGKIIPGISFCSETIGEKARAAVRALQPGDVLVLENLRRDRGERDNDPGFARELASLADVFVQDSFDTCHRSHASIVGIPKLLPSYAGLTLQEEVAELSRALTPKAPSLAVIGGAKFSTKETVLAALLERYDRVFVGGALANDFLKSAGHPIGRSLVSDDISHLPPLLANPKLVLPIDSLVVPEGNRLAPPRVASLDQVRPEDIIIDHGPATAALLSGLAENTATILWNGPLGTYEQGFTACTEAFARAVARSGAHSIVGGGDTIAAIEKLDLLPRFSFVSTGGGAMLEFLARGTLPGIAALDKS